MVQHDSKVQMNMEGTRLRRREGAMGNGRGAVLPGTNMARSERRVAEEMPPYKRSAVQDENGVRINRGIRYPAQRSVVRPVQTREPNNQQNPYLADYARGNRQTKGARGAGGVREMSYIDTSPAIRRQPARSSIRREGDICNPARHVSGKRRRKCVWPQWLALIVWCVFIGLVTVAVLDKINGTSVEGNAGGRLPETMMGGNGRQALVQGIAADIFAKHPEWTEDLLTPNEYSRPGDPLEKVANIFVHYTANPGTSAAQNRNYFEQQKDLHERSVSSHFIIGYEGEIVQCVPLDEIAYAVKSRNFDSISIECCFLEEDGSFTQATYDSLISLLAWLTDAYDLESEDILRHYDCGGKKCPLYYTDHPDAWEALKKDVDKL